MGTCQLRTTHTLGSLDKKASFPILSLSKYQFEVQLHQGTGHCHSPVFPKIQRVAAPTKPQPFCGSNPAAPVTLPEWPPPRKTVSNPVWWCCRLHPGKHNKTVSNLVCWCSHLHVNTTRQLCLLIFILVNTTRQYQSLFAGVPIFILVNTTRQYQCSGVPIFILVNTTRQSKPVCWCSQVNTTRSIKAFCWCPIFILVRQQDSIKDLHPGKHNKTVSKPVCWCSHLHPGEHTRQYQSLFAGVPIFILVNTTRQYQSLFAGVPIFILVNTTRQYQSLFAGVPITSW